MDAKNLCASKFRRIRDHYVEVEAAGRKAYEAEMEKMEKIKEGLEAEN